MVRLPRGTPLRMTEAAIRQGLQGRLDRRTGKLIGPALKRDCIRVHRDGIKSPENYHWSFWEPNDKALARSEAELPAAPGSHSNT